MHEVLELLHWRVSLGLKVVVAAAGLVPTLSSIYHLLLSVILF
jgi:hypothetical protein